LWLNLQVTKQTKTKIYHSQDLNVIKTVVNISGICIKTFEENAQNKSIKKRTAWFHVNLGEGERAPNEPLLACHKS
jgi:hypothetical protein